MSDKVDHKGYVLSCHPGAEVRTKGRWLRVFDGEKLLGSGDTEDKAWERAYTVIHQNFVLSRYPNARAEPKGLFYCAIMNGREFITGGSPESEAWANAAERIRQDEEPEAEPDNPSPGPGR